MKYTVYHNTRCRKSREALCLLEEKTKDIEVVEYLKNPLTVAQLTDLISKLKIKPEELVRKTEDLYKENYKGKTLSDIEWIKVLSENPILMERPVIVKGDKAVIGRPPERVPELL